MKTRKEALLCAVFLLLLPACKKEASGAEPAASASASPTTGTAAPGACETIAPADYCVAVPAGYERDDSRFVDEVLKEKGGGKNIWDNRTEGKAYDDGSQLTISYDPEVDSYDTWLSFFDGDATKKEKWKELPTVEALPSGNGKHFRGTEADGKWTVSRSIAKGAKFWVECRATTPAKAPDAALLDACKTISVK